MFCDTFSACDLAELHKHLVQHYEGGNYYYHHTLRTAFPKHEYACTGSQTSLKLLASASTQTEEYSVLTELMSLDVRTALSVATQTDFDSNDQGMIVNNSVTNVFDTQGCEHFKPDHNDLSSIQEKKNVDERLVVPESDEKTVCIVKEEILSEDIADESDLQFSDNNDVLHDRSSTDDYSHDEGETYLSNSKEQDWNLINDDRFKNKHDDRLTNKQTCKKKRKYNDLKKQKVYLKQTKSLVDKKQSSLCDDVSEKVRKKSTQLSFKCMVCDREFASWKSWSIHIESLHYHIYPDKCHQCSLIYKSPDEASCHDCETAKQFNHVCWLCPKPLCFRWSENIRQHLNDVHNGVLQSSCKNCNLKFVSDFELNCHMTEHDPSLLNCPICKKAMATYANLKSHILLHKRNHICERCGKCFTKRESFKHHVWACIGKFACHECNKTFCTNRRLKCHMLIHTGERPFICEQCGQPFRSKEGLKSHKKFIHSRERNYKCNQCDKSFTNGNTLKRHEKVHMKIRPFACEFCSKQCSTKWNLDAHMRQHNGKKPYSCNICGVAFAHNVARKNHEAKCTFKVNYSEATKEWNSGCNTLL